MVFYQEFSKASYHIQENILIFFCLLFDIGLKSIFETGFKRHSEPRLPSTAQINH